MSEMVFTLRINFSKKLITWRRRKAQLKKIQRTDARKREIGTYIDHEKLEDVLAEIKENAEEWLN